MAPQGLGNHVDHLQTIRAVSEVFPAEKTLWYRDTPYAIRQPDALPSDLLPAELFPLFLEIEAYLPQKIAGCATYESQVNFQFGGSKQLKPTLEKFHRTEARKTEEIYSAAEIFLTILTPSFPSFTLNFS